MNRYLGYTKLSGEESIRLLDALEIPANFYILYILLRRKTIRFSYLYHLLTYTEPRVSKLQLQWYLAQLEMHQIIRKITYEDDFYILNPQYISSLAELYQDTLADEIHQLTYVLERNSSV